MGQHWSHLTPTKRIQLDAFIRAGMKPTDIAKELGVHHTTIYRELKRCTYEHLNSDYTTETRYNPEGAQARYEANLRAKGPELKIGNDYELADYLIAKIRDEKYSPEAAIGEAEVKGWPFKTHICASTAYNYIRGEIFGDELTVSMLPQHGKRHQPERPAGSMPRKPAGRSIEDRPEHINDRSTFGHWEMDSVESCQGVSNTYIVMTERKTRWELIIPSPDKTAASVVAAIDGLEAKYGDLFPKVFRSITCDNGCEFADAAGIERSASGKGTRTEVYYCHPYRPSERGSNENQNGLIRRHLPKGTDLSTISYEETKRIEDWLNNYPRKSSVICAPSSFSRKKSPSFWPHKKYFCFFVHLLLTNGMLSIIIKRTETQLSRLCVFSLLQPHRTEVRLTGKYRYLTFEDRKKIEAWHLLGDRPVDIAARLSVHHTTIYKELQRGATGALDANQREGYSAELAERRLRESFKRRGKRASAAQ